MHYSIKPFKNHVKEVSQRYKNSTHKRDHLILYFHEQGNTFMFRNDTTFVQHLVPIMQNKLDDFNLSDLDK